MWQSWDSGPPVSELFPPASTPYAAGPLAAVCRLGEVPFVGRLLERGITQARFSLVVVRRDTGPPAWFQRNLIGTSFLGLMTSVVLSRHTTEHRALLPHLGPGGSYQGDLFPACPSGLDGSLVSGFLLVRGQWWPPTCGAQPLPILGQYLQSRIFTCDIAEGAKQLHTLTRPPCVLGRQSTSL